MANRSKLSSNSNNATSFWSNEELRAAVRVYLDMLGKSQRGEAFSKTQYYLELSQQFGRTPKAFEYRMQNISYVLSLTGRQWLKGLKPAKNVGGGVAAEIEEIIFELEDQRFLPVAAFETQVRKSLDSGDISPPPGVSRPVKSDITITRIERNPQVKVWILQNAGDTCECCSNAAPFVTAEGAPFLEVHHLKRLADKGSDRISNAIAVCPNCHRELHFGANSDVLLNRLYLKISRLIRE